MNKTIMMGRLTRDPETRYIAETGLAISNIDIAVDKRFKKEGDATADFFRWTAFGKTAEFIEKYIRKGTRVLVEGRTENHNYTNKDGVKVYGFQFIVDNVEFADSKKATDQQEEDDGFVELPEEELCGLPFAKKE